jgi:hypothetical protein
MPHRRLGLRKPHDSPISANRNNCYCCVFPHQRDISRICLLRRRGTCFQAVTRVTRTDSDPNSNRLVGIDHLQSGLDQNHVGSLLGNRFLLSVKQKGETENMLAEKLRVGRLLRILEILYVVLLSFSLYLLLASRTAEAHTIWEPMNPLLMPTLFLSTTILFSILFTQERSSLKLLLVMVHSILLHSFFSIIFPAGDASGQQMYLGRIRFAFDSDALQAWLPSSPASFQLLVTESFRSLNFQAAITTLLARLLSIDIFWIHLFLVPTLWGVFTPLATYLISRTLSNNETHAILSSLIVSAFPYATYFGAISTPNSLGYIFFIFALYFMLRYIISGNFRCLCLMGFFSVSSFFFHPLTGVISFSLLVLALAFRSYGGKDTLWAHKKQLFLVFLLCLTLLPVSFIYLRLLGIPSTASFTLDKLSET